MWPTQSGVYVEMGGMLTAPDRLCRGLRALMGGEQSPFGLIHGPRSWVLELRETWPISNGARGAPWACGGSVESTTHAGASLRFRGNPGGLSTESTGSLCTPGAARPDARWVIVEEPETSRRTVGCSHDRRVIDGGLADLYTSRPSYMAVWDVPRCFHSARPPRGARDAER